MKEMNGGREINTKKLNFPSILKKLEKPKILLEEELVPKCYMKNM